MNIGVLEHPKVAESAVLADEICAWLAAQGVDSWRASTWDSDGIAEGAKSADLVLVLGGDGSMLTAARATAAAQVPVLGVNFGRLGFLCEVPRREWQTALEKVLDGKHWIQHRTMLQGSYRRGNEKGETVTAVNEFVVGRGTRARVVRLRLYVDGDYVTNFTADGLIIATPTGSTAYAMAAGGPILPPQLPNYMVIPVAPHLSLDRAVILPPNAVTRIEVEMDDEATLTADGRDSFPLVSGDEIIISKSPNDCLFARIGDSGYFYSRLMEKLGY